jgi:hypothetical protein
MLFRLIRVFIISGSRRYPRQALTRLPDARPLSLSFSLSLSAAFRLLLAGADTEAEAGSVGCFRFCARACSPLSVPVRMLGPLSMPRLSESGALPALGKKSRNAEDKSGASLKSSSTFAKTSACRRIVRVRQNLVTKDEHCLRWTYDSLGSPKTACMCLGHC